MKGWRIEGKIKTDLTRDFAIKAMQASKLGVNVVKLCKVLQIPVTFTSNAKGSFDMKFNCTTKQISGHISKINDFILSNNVKQPSN